jgi:mono/diheme cytochrome c family protein
MATVAAVAMAACGGDAGEELPEETQPPEETEQMGQAEETAAPANLPEGVTQDQFAQGKQLFTGQGACHACHGPQATGTQLGPDLTDGEWLNISGRNYDEIVSVINSGVAQPVEHPGPMPPMGGASLNAEQVEALAAYIAGLGQG